MLAGSWRCLCICTIPDHVPLETLLEEHACLLGELLTDSWCQLVVAYSKYDGLVFHFAEGWVGSQHLYDCCSNTPVCVNETVSWLS